MQALESTKTSQVIPADLARLLHLLPFPSHRAVVRQAPNKAELEVLANMLQICVDRKGASIPLHESLKDSCLESDVIRRAKVSLVAKGCLSTSGSNHLISDSGKGSMG